MAEEGLSNIPVGEFETVSQLIASSESLQIAFANTDCWFNNNWGNLP